MCIDLEHAPTIGRCKKCGRGFVTLPDAKPWIDHYYPDDLPLPPKSELPTDIECGGEIELTEAGREAFARGPQPVT